MYELVASAPIAYYTYIVSDAVGGNGSPFQQQVPPPSMPSDKVYIHVLEYDGITIHIHIAPNLSRIVPFIRGLEAAVPRYTIPPRSQQRDKTVYHISISVALSSFGAARHTRRPKLPTALSISQYTRRNCTIHIPIYSRYLKERSLPTPTINCSASSNQSAPQP